jgi:hypothetical protein
MTEIDRLGENATTIDEFNFDPRDPDFLDCVSLNLHCNRLSRLTGLSNKLVLLTELNLSSNDFVSFDLPELAFLPALRSVCCFLPCRLSCP